MSPPPSPVRRRLRAFALWLLAFVAATWLAADTLLRQLGGASPLIALERPDALSGDARALLDEVYRGLDPARLVDVHTHLVGLGSSSDCRVNERMLSWSSPKDRVRFLVYRDAAGIRSEATADEDFVATLGGLAAAQPHPTRHLLLAFDWRYRVGVGETNDTAGTNGTNGANRLNGAIECDIAHSEFHVPNDYAFEIAARDPAHFIPAASIHPYRPDAVAELERCVARGARFVKWLPNAMGIDPADPRCDPFYAACARLGVTILTHSGEEQAVEAEADQALGNPLRLRRALDAGVRVIAAHCASLGSDEDLDAPDRPRVPSFELFLRLMGEERYEGLLFGGLSAVTQRNRFGAALATLLARGDLHGRLVYGSDWPLPAVNVVISTRALVDAGFLEPAERAPLNELYDYNPLLFSLALARRVRHPESGARFADAAFQPPLEWFEPLGAEDGRPEQPR